MKRIVTLQDISCIGKCSLTVALPVISSMGIETAVIPTAVLSTHTAFDGFFFRDLTEDILPTAAHWKKEGFRFDAIYTGYMGSKEQIDIVSGFFDEFGTEDNIIIVDPAMADGGKIYRGFDADFPEQMKKLVSRADVIIPNLTEACLLTGVDYRESYDEQFISGLIKKLEELGCRKAVITGISFEEDRLGAVFSDGKGGYGGYFGKKCPKSFHGTGDIFASVVTGGLTNGMVLADAVRTAVDFVIKCLDFTSQDNDPRWYGVDFEPALPWLSGQVTDYKKIR